MSLRTNASENGNALYELAASVIKNTKDGTVGFKYAFNNTNIHKRWMRPVYGIGAKAMNNWQVCNEILEKSGIFEEYPNIDKELFRVIIVDLLWGQKKLYGKGIAVNAVWKKRNVLLELLKKYSEPAVNQLPVFFVRVNSLKSSVESCLTELEKLGYTLVSTPSSYKKYIKALKSLDEDKFMIDYHFDDLLSFNMKAKSSIIASDLFKDNAIVIQSKSSLIPVKLLNVKPGKTVLDMCAAPGMKTAIIAARLKGKGKLYAVDKDRLRFKEMLTNLNNQIGDQDNIEYINKDVLLLECDSESINLILLDAPCSGSGITTRFGETNYDAERLKKLQWIQMKLLTHALTAYPNAKRVVYSTCSIYTEENEAVIDEVIERNKGTLNYELRNCHGMIEGFSQGSSDFKSGPFCLKVSIEKDFSNGFFVAVFDKVKHLPGISEEVADDDKQLPNEAICDEAPQTERKAKKRKHPKVNNNSDVETEKQVEPEISKKLSGETDLPQSCSTDKPKKSKKRKEALNISEDQPSIEEKPKKEKKEKSNTTVSQKEIIKKSKKHKSKSKKTTDTQPEQE